MSIGAGAFSKPSPHKLDELFCSFSTYRDVNQVLASFAAYFEDDLGPLVNISLLHLANSAAPLIAAYTAQRQARLRSAGLAPARPAPLTPNISQQPGATTPASKAALRATNTTSTTSTTSTSTTSAITTSTTSTSERSACWPEDPSPHQHHYHPACGPSPLDWSSCCAFNLYRGRGPVVQPPPAWPLACTAAFHCGVVEQDVVLADNYSAEGPHFQDLTALHLKGAESMVCVPLLACGVPCAVLCLASREKHAFRGRLQQIRTMAAALAPYASMLQYTTRTSEMQRLLNEMITPIAAQLARQKSSQLPQLGCSLEEGGPSDAAADRLRRSSGCCISSHSTAKLCAAAALPLAAVLPNGDSDLSAHWGGGGGGGGGGGAGRGGGGGAGTPSKPARQRRGESGASTVSSGGAASSSTASSSSFVDPRITGWRSLPGAGCGAAAASTAAICTATSAAPVAAAAMAPSIAAAAAAAASALEAEADPLALAESAEVMDWGSFCFNLISCVIVYIYFSKAAVASESLVAIVLCMGVAFFDIVLLLMRWLWLEQYIRYGGAVLSVFQLYRAVVLPIANTFMSYSLLTKLELTPSYGVICLLAVLLVVFVLLGLQMRFFLQAPLQLASVLFAASSTSDVCLALLGSTSSLRCIGVISALQLSLGLLLPAAVVWALEAKAGRGGHTFMPHCVAKRWLLHPP